MVRSLKASGHRRPDRLNRANINTNKNQRARRPLKPPWGTTQGAAPNSITSVSDPLSDAERLVVLMVPEPVAREMLQRGEVSVPDSDQRSAGELADLVVATASSAGPSLLGALEKQAAFAIASRLWSALKRLRGADRNSVEFKLSWREGHASLKADVSDPDAIELLAHVLDTVSNHGGLSDPADE